MTLEEFEEFKNRTPIPANYAPNRRDGYHINMLMLTSRLLKEWQDNEPGAPHSAFAFWLQRRGKR